jgi:hypothetical protein
MPALPFLDTSVVESLVQNALIIATISLCCFLPIFLALSGVYFGLNAGRERTANKAAWTVGQIIVLILIVITFGLGTFGLGSSLMVYYNKPFEITHAYVDPTPAPTEVP